MATINESITGIARNMGYEGESPKTIAEAVDALGGVIGSGGGFF